MAIIKKTLLEDRKVKTQNVVEVAYSGVLRFLEQAKRGELTEEEAKIRAQDMVRALRYEGNNYFWINDYHPKMVMHPMKPALEGKDLSETADPEGTKLFAEMVKVVKQSGEGFVPYMWDKPDSGTDAPQPKLSFVKGIAEWQWIIGSGIYIDDVEKQFNKELIQAMITIAIACCVLGLVAWLIIRSISDPLTEIAKTMGILAENKTAVSPYDGRADEIGTISLAVNDLNAKLEQARALEGEQKAQQLRAEKEKKELMLKMADDFDLKVGEALNTLTVSATELQSSAEQMQDIADKTTSSSEAVSNSSEDASQNVNTVAAAMEEMSASVAEIAEQIVSAKAKSNDTAKNAKDANETVGNLNVLVRDIGEVVVAIQDIAEQTNLLALNATIEAARAGESGKGFAVVADEVKKLANETATKTEEINTRITEIQNATKDSVDGMGRILSNISEIDSAVTGISAAVEEQNATTNEIARSIAEASSGVSQVANVIIDVKSGAMDTGRSADSVLTASKQVAALSHALEGSVSAFLDQIRAE